MNGTGRNRRLAIIVPVLNEATCIASALAALQPLRARGARLIVVDGGSQDDTIALARTLADEVIISDRGRARQMNAGARHARDADALLFLHADTRLPEDADRLIADAIQGGARWGRFDVRIDGRSPWLAVVAALMNLRSRLTGICTGDQALFVERRLFDDLHGYADVPLMEDIEFCRRARAVSSPAAIARPVVTSGRRWEQRGVWRTIRLMWSLRWRYWRGEDPAALAREYREVR
jgi:rSAM/selenodomain-associated transferase 2